MGRSPFKPFSTMTSNCWDLRRVWGYTTGKLPVSTLVSLIDLVSQQKSAHHQSGTVYVTTHRLFYYSSQSPGKYSFSFDLAHTTQTDYYSGLFTSSPKVTLHLGSLDDVVGTEDDASEGWECHVCSYRNPPGTSRNAQVCALCGVPRSDLQHPSPTSKSLPSSRSVTPFPSEIACTACTFLNPVSSKSCEICGTTLPGMHSGTAPPSPVIKPVSDSDPRLIRVSFRKSGDKNFYTILKRSLQGKAWEVSCSSIFYGGSSPDSYPQRRVDTKRSDTPALGIGQSLRSTFRFGFGVDPPVQTGFSEMQSPTLKQAAQI